MKLGSIVGIVISCLLIIGGIVLCALGKSYADNAGQPLFTQVTEDGTYYNQKIEKGTNRLKLSYDNANIRIIGGAEKSQIEFNNFNPNLYSLSVTPIVIAFEETQKISSIVDMWENGINFKGLRYVLDFRNKGYDDLPKSIVISIADDSDLKSIDITGKKSKVTIKDLSLDGDISLSVESGKIEVDNVNSTSTFEINGTKIDTTITNLNVPTLRYNSSNSKLKINESTFTSTNINVDKGLVEYNSSENLDGTLMSVTSEIGSVTVNYMLMPEGLSTLQNEYTKDLTIKCKEASVVLSYPTESSSPTDNGDSSSDSANITQ